MELNLNQRLRHIRRLLNLTQKEFAEQLSIKQGSLSDIERERIGVSSKVFESVVGKFKVSPVWLHSGAGEIFTVKNYKIKGNGTGLDTGVNRKAKYKKALESIEIARRNNTGYWVLFHDELKNERPDLAELITLSAQIGRLANELPELDRIYFKPTIDELDMLTANSYSEYKTQAVRLLETSLPYLNDIKPVVKILKELIDSGKFPIPQK